MSTAANELSSPQEQWAHSLDPLGRQLHSPPGATVQPETWGISSHRAPAKVQAGGSRMSDSENTPTDSGVALHTFHGKDRSPKCCPGAVGGAA